MLWADITHAHIHHHQPHFGDIINFGQVKIEKKKQFFSLNSSILCIENSFIQTLGKSNKDPVSRLIMIILTF